MSFLMNKYPLSVFASLTHTAPVRKMILSELFRITAAGFGTQAPALMALDCEARQQAYALFTRDHAVRVLHSGQEIQTVRSRLYRNAFVLGGRMSRWCGVNGLDEVVRLAQLIYRAIGVEVQGDSQGNLTVLRCYYSRFYSAPVCDLISCLDDGLLTGLNGGGRLVFLSRITEGSRCCRAKLARS